MAYSYDRRKASNSESDADPIDYDSMKALIRDDLRALRTGFRTCEAIRQIVLSLADPLETPALKEEAKKIQDRLDSLNRIADLYAEATTQSKAFMQDLRKEATDLAKKYIATHGKDSKTKIELPSDAQSFLNKLSSYKQLVHTTEALSALFSRIENQEDIDWTLSSYLTDEVGIQKRLENYELLDMDDLNGPATLYGLLKNYADDDSLRDLVDEAIEKLV